MIIQPFSKTYDTSEVLHFPGCEILPGKIYGVVGANGSGKTTFLRILAGTVDADEKKNLLITNSSARISIGYLPQKSYVFRMSALKNLMLVKKDEREALAMLEQIGLSHLKNKKAHTFSGGEAARLCLGRLLMASYELLLLDEPTAALDVASTIQVEQLIRDYVTKTNAAVIIITHNLKQAKRLTDEILYFKDGKLEEQGESTRVLEHPKSDALREFMEFQ